MEKAQKNSSKLMNITEFDAASDSDDYKSEQFEEEIASSEQKYTDYSKDNDYSI